MEKTHQLSDEYDVYHSYGRRCSPISFPNSFHRVMEKKGLRRFHRIMKSNISVENISVHRLKAMKDSRIFIVSISAGYASSVFCLNELVEILNFMKLRNQLVCPVFDNVDPSDVMYLRNRFGEAMSQHERRFGSNIVKKWKSALLEVSSLSGWHLQTTRYSGLDTINQTARYNLFAEKVVSWITRSLKRFDVFLSFSRTDTLDPFTSYIYNTLHRNGYNTFVEDEGWVNTEKNSQFHIEAIEESKFSIIIFSNNYAKSLCRLDALIKILECKRLKNQRVIPIFYKVQPSSVRHQASHYFHEAMAIHENRFGKESAKVQNWKAALSKVANLSGLIFEDGSVHETLEKILKRVNKDLPRYDVFLSFRGKDTRHPFVSQLYAGLSKKGFKTFMDNQALECGDQISQALDYAIQNSRFSIIVFSKNYADSKWCLNELVNILERKRKENHKVWAIYYKVEPSDVWHQRNSYAKAMKKHEITYRMQPTVVQKWRSALSEVATLEFRHFKDGFEHKFIEQIVNLIILETQAATRRLTHVL